MKKSRSDNLQKFEKKPKGSAIKEQIKQEKKKAKKERAEAIEKHYAKKREERLLQRGGNNTSAAPANKAPYPKSAAPKKAYSKPSSSTKTSTKPTNSKTNTLRDSVDTKRDHVPFKRELKPQTASKKTYSKLSSSTKTSTKPTNVTQAKASEDFVETKPANVAVKREPKPQSTQKNVKGSKVEKAVTKLTEASTEKMPLNKYIAHSGICSRRDAATLVKDHKVTVNGVVVTDPGTKISADDVIKVSGNKITPTKNLVYILLNKPKDFITTLDDPQGRKTVLDLVKQATTERIYPVGRLDRNTSGVLLLTNDGELAQKLSHPKHEIKKVYEVKLDRNLTKGDMDKIAEGLTLEDGFIAPDVIAYADAKDKSVIGIEIHSGRNRIVRRIFEHMKYDVRALDRVMYAGLTKKDVLRGKWRFLNDKEIRLLKYMNKSYVKSKAD